MPLLGSRWGAGGLVEGGESSSCDPLRILGCLVALLLALFLVLVSL